MKDIWKKVSIFFLAMLIVSFSGCYNASKEKKEKTVAEQKENLVIWAYYETQAQRNGLNELVKNFNQSQNEYEVEWEYVPMTGFVKGLSSAYTENKLPDMAILDNPDTPPEQIKDTVPDPAGNVRRYHRTGKELESGRGILSVNP